MFKRIALSILLSFLSTSVASAGIDWCYEYSKSKEAADTAIEKCTADINSGKYGDPDSRGNNRLAMRYLLRGNAYQHKGSYENAMADYNKALKLDSLFATAFYERGKIYQTKQNFSKAVNDYNKAIELEPKLYVAYYKRASLESLRNNAEEACTWLKKGVDIKFSRERIENDKDFDKIRNAECYKKIMSGR